ncbi:DNA repair and recombination protein RadB [Nanoarchaeota archaeon NZ13-N]|uniref:DNA repair and recombination protein RadB n=1 Tax=Candidatus Nanoclepta minutus TaxID=1940235 RepID=A0A397WMZ3_9ARCH|nr:MAG: DNA repair and recombination protein RadB [Nanoarchaeota archaeon NZ13-N]RIB35271.1 MAG: DNA repair and recombination protein RadB [Candidatus Nanoclepta minutus]
MGNVSTGVIPIDKLLDGGLEDDIITAIYGPSSSGKTNIAIISAINIILSGKKAIYMDTEGGLSFERIRQIAKNKFDDVLKNIYLFQPVNFQEQKRDIYNIYKHVKERKEEIGIIIIDSISMLYRLERGDQEVREVNMELAKQLQILAEIARRYKIPVLVTNQVYSPFDEREKIEIVGGDLIRYWSKCLIELRVIGEGVRVALLRKHRHLPEGRSVKFIITNDGIEEYKEEKEELF